MYFQCGGMDLTEHFREGTCSGDIKTIARKFQFSLISSPSDINLPEPFVRMGDLVQLFEGGNIFTGIVVDKQKSISGNKVTYTAYDHAFFLARSKGSFNFENKTPGQITREVCKAANIPTGYLPEGEPMSRIFQNETYYNIIMTCYKQQGAKDGNIYMLRMQGGAVNVIEKGKHFAAITLSPSENITDAEYTESVENSINRVVMYDQEGNMVTVYTIGEVPGVMQDEYRQVQNEDRTAQAKAKLKGVERTAKVTAFGDWTCLSGNAIYVIEPYTGIVGLFYIDNDTHTFSNKQHTMNLGLNYENEGGEES